VFRLTLLGVGAMNSPRFAPAGLLVEHSQSRVMLDGGPGAEPREPLDAWLVTDARAELIRQIHELASALGVVPRVEKYKGVGDLEIAPRRVEHTSHPTYGYLIVAEGKRIVWAPEFWRFPRWAAGADLLFADAAGWDRPIRFAKGVGGHVAAVEMSEEARRRGVRRLVLAHIGRPTIRAMDAGKGPPFGTYGRDGATYLPRLWRDPARE
jgi:Beta-lactamase superfamily domain